MRTLLLLALLTTSTFAQSMPPSETPGGLQSFDPLRVQISWSQEGWRLMNGYTVLKEFGRNQREAREALRIIRDLRLSQRGTVGSPQTVMEYWLAKGRAPEGQLHGVRVFLIDLPSIRVEQLNQQWCLRDDARIYFNFGLRESDAKQSLDILKRYKFNRLATLGTATPSMMIFLSEPTDHQHINHPTLAQRMAERPSLKDRVRQIKEQENKDKGVKNAVATDMASSIYATPAVAPLRGTRNNRNFDTGLRQASMTTTSNVPGINDLTQTIPFDWRQVQLSSKNGQWWLQVGTYELAHFGNNEVLARKAVGLIHYYRFTQHCLVGHPKPLYSYFLVNGQMPRGMPFGVQHLAFESSNLTVKNQNGMWTLCDEEKPLLQVGPRRDEAYQLMVTLQQHRADRLCWLGDKPHGAFTFFCRSR